MEVVEVERPAVKFSFFNILVAHHAPPGCAYSKGQKAYLIMYIRGVWPIQYKNYCILQFCLHTTRGAVESPYNTRYIH